MTETIDLARKTFREQHAPVIPAGVVVTTENLAELVDGEPEVWPQFRKTKLTAAVRISGPFRVQTSESESEPFYCENGWLAVDARGYPYAISDDEFELIYAAADEEPELPSPFFFVDLNQIAAALTAGALDPRDAKKAATALLRKAELL